MGVDKEIFGLFSENVNVLLVPHGIVDSVYFDLLISYCVIEFIEIIYIPSSAFIILYGIMSAVLKVVIKVLDGLVSVELSPQGIVVNLE